MDKKEKLNLQNKQLIKYVKIIIIILLIVIEVLICAQCAPLFVPSGDIAMFVAVVVCCVVLAIMVTIDSFVESVPAAKFVFFGFDSALLLAICIMTGNSYLSTLYCIVLTQFYISLNDIKTNFILFGVSCGLFIVSFASSWFVTNSFVSLYDSIIKILGDALVGVAFIATHAVVANFILRFYNNNLHLRKALKEADESKAQLKEVYEELSRTAVFEERNRIAKDIHDNAGHSMTTVIMQTEAAKLLIDTNPEEAKNRIISANMQAKNALEQMRESVHLLAGRNQVRTLKEEIEEIIAQTMDGTGLKVRCDIEDITVNEEVLRYVCNSVKECLANGIRHGKATAFYIEMKKSSALNILISDNGCGAVGEIKEGFGLKGVREKAEALGGKCSFSSEADEGFEVEISLPV